MKYEAKNLALVIFSTAALMTTACGKFQNSPDSEYDHYHDISQTTEKVLYPEANKNIAKQDNRELIQAGNFIEIKTDGSLSFIEGEASEFVVKARLTQIQMNYELVFSGLPDGAVVEKQTSDTYKVKWTPKPGFIGPKDESKSVKFEVELKQASPLSTVEQSLFNKQTRKQAFDLVVNRTKETPSVEKVEGLDGLVSEGTKVKFSVQVRDPGAQSSEAPKVTIKKDTEASQETVSIDGADFISQDPEQATSSSSPGIWTFHYVYDTQTKAAPRPQRLGTGNKRLAADEIPVRFKIEVVSPSRHTTSTSREFRLKYDTENQAPQFVVAQGDSLTADAGTTVQIDIKVSSKIAGSQIVVAQDEAQKLLNQNLPGGSAANIFRCKNNGSSEVDCRLGWKVPCDAAVGSIAKLTVKAVNSVGAVGVEGILDRPITVTKTKECTAANPTAGGKK